MPNADVAAAISAQGNSTSAPPLACKRSNDSDGDSVARRRAERRTHYDSNDSDEDPLLNDPQATAFLSLAPGTLSVWRSTGRYKLPFIKIGRSVRYRRSVLAQFLENRTRISGATE